ncbi:MAG: DUF4317 domain-containing protein [Clostridiales bacterium]|nr:DUF4317 domain-containing protein [Clostridiales bacterium]
MNKKEVSEIKKLMAPDRSAITRICGCYVDGEKKKRTELKEAFLSIPQEEMFKYFEIFRKTLSGTIGKNLINLNFPLEQEFENGTQQFLLRLRDSQLKDDALLEQFYDKIIESYYYGENYYIILIHGAYDIPKRGTDNIEMDDASDYVYEYILCSICPVKLSKAGLCYNSENNTIEERIRDWIVDVPDSGFLFPAFHDRNTDIHSMLYYSRNAKELQTGLIEDVFGCSAPLTAVDQKESFNSLLEETLKENCNYETIRTVHEKLTEQMKEKEEEASSEPITLNRFDVKRILEHAANTELEDFDQTFEESVGEEVQLLAANIANTQKFEIKTPEVTIKVASDRTDLVETKWIDGVPCLVIQITDQIQVNGVHVNAMKPEDFNQNE